MATVVVKEEAIVVTVVVVESRETDVAGDKENERKVDNGKEAKDEE